MNYSIPRTREEIIALRDSPVNEELIARVVAGVVKIARSEGKSLEDLTAEVLEEDDILDRVQRRWTGDLVARAWKIVP